MRSSPANGAGAENGRPYVAGRKRGRAAEADGADEVGWRRAGQVAEPRELEGTVKCARTGSEPGFGSFSNSSPLTEEFSSLASLEDGQRTPGSSSTASVGCFGVYNVRYDLQNLLLRELHLERMKRRRAIERKNGQQHFKGGKGTLRGGRSRITVPALPSGLNSEMNEGSMMLANGRLLISSSPRSGNVPMCTQESSEPSYDDRQQQLKRSRTFSSSEDMMELTPKRHRTH